MNAEVFATFGVYVRKQFLDADVCRQVAAEVRSAATRPATVREDNVQSVDAAYRKSRFAEVSDSTAASMHARMLGLKDDLERHFGITTTGCRSPDFLIYRPGDFFSPHADSLPAGQQADAVVTTRRLTVVAFLNGESAAARDDAYQGGELEFYGLVDDARLKNRALPLTGEAGLLVAFRAETMHAVSPIVAGERLTVVTWFEG